MLWSSAWKQGGRRIPHPHRLHFTCKTSHEGGVTSMRIRGDNGLRFYKLTQVPENRCRTVNKERNNLVVMMTECYLH